MVEKTITGLSLSILYDAGVVDGKQQTFRRSFSNISTSATDENIHATASTISELCEREDIAFELRTVESLVY